MRSKYTVTSKTSRDGEGFSDYCWMEIGKSKLHEAAENNELYYFYCSIGGEEFAYSYPAVDLEKAFNDKLVRIRGEKPQRYSFFIEYPTGRILRKLSVFESEENFVCALTAEMKDKQKHEAATESSAPSECIADSILREALREAMCDHLPQLVARTALWATLKEYKECLKNSSPAKYPHICRKPAGEKRGKHGDLYWDDNSYPNAQMKASLKKQGIIPIGYETCHIWEKTCYDPHYHTCYANLVLLPRAIASLSDHNDTIKAILKWQAYERFNEFLPGGCVMPDKPKIYDKIKHLFRH